MNVLVQTPAPAAATGTLARLADVAVPPPVPWTPQTIGWPVAGALLGTLTLWAAWRGLRRYRANRYRRAALAELAALRPRLSGSPDDRARALLALAQVLKRTALAAWPRADVAPLAGASWAAFLAAHAGPAREAAALLAQLVDDAEYRAPDVLSQWSAHDAQAVAEAARHWIAGHRIAGQGHVHA